MQGALQQNGVAAESNKTTGDLALHGTAIDLLHIVAVGCKQCSTAARLQGCNAVWALGDATGP